MYAFELVGAVLVALFLAALIDPRLNTDTH
jgi:hypothetical protein